MSGKQKPTGWGPLGAGPQRLNKVLAAAGLGSRRACDEFISEGRVEVNGEVVAQLGMKVDPSVDQIKVDGEALKKNKPVYYALNKPPGVVSTNSDPDGRPRVVDLVPDKERLFSVGRLDRSSEGLMLLTNDGELAQKLAHPKYQITKTYYVTVQGSIDIAHLARLERGIHLAEGLAKVDKVKIRKQRRHATDLEIELSEGKNREIRRILARLGHKVVELKRVAIGTLRLGDIPTGAYRPLTAEEVRKLHEEAESARHKKKENRKRKTGGAKITAPGPIEDELNDDDLANELEAEQMLESDDLGVVVDYSSGGNIEEFVPPVDEDDEDAVDIDFDEDEFEADEDSFEDEDDLPNVIIDEDGDEIILPPSVTEQRRAPRSDRPRSDRPRGDRPRSDRPRGGSGDRGFRDRDAGSRSFGERGERRGFGDRPRSDRPRGDGPRGERRDFGDRPRGDGPRGRSSGDRGFRGRDSGSRDSGGRDSGERRERRGFDERPRFERDRQERGERRSGGERGFGGERRSDGERRFGGERGERSERRPFSDRGDRPRREGGFRDRDRAGGRDGGRDERAPRDRGPSDRGPRDRGYSDRGYSDRAGGDRGYGDRRGGRDFGGGRGDRPSSGRSGGGRPGGGRPGGGRPGGGRPGGGRPGSGGRPGGGGRTGGGRPGGRGRD